MKKNWSEKSKSYNKKKTLGISLIVLVITIVVIVIIASAVILTINNNNPIENANKARYLSDRASIQNALASAVGKIAADKLCSVTIPGQADISTGIIYTLSGANDGIIGGKIGWESYTSDAPAGYEQNTILGMKQPIYSSTTKWMVSGNGQVVVEESGKYYTGSEVLDGYVTDSCMLHLDGSNNTGNGHSDTTTTWKDLSGSGNDGTLHHVDQTEGSKWESNYLLLDGVDDYVKFSNIINGLPNFTIEMAYKPLRYMNYQYIWGVKANQFGLEGTAKGKYLYYTFKDCSYTEPGTDMKWQQGTYVFEENGDITVYQNGKMVQTLKNITRDASGEFFGIGANVPAENYHTKMECYGFRIYNRALSEKEVEQNYKIDQLMYAK